MTRRELLKTAASVAPALVTAGIASGAGGKILKNMGSAGPGLGARIRAARDALSG